MHVEPSSPLVYSIAAMWFLPILHMNWLPLLGLNFHVSGILASGAEERPSHAVVISAGTAANPDPLWGQLMTKDGRVKKGARRLGSRDEEDASGQSREAG